jgi:membrane-bound lytic murein transglycosylase B
MYQPYAERPEVQAFIQHVSVKDNIDKQQLTMLFYHVKPNMNVIRAMGKPSEHVSPWFVYRGIFITPSRAHDGAVYWSQHQQTLAYAQRKYGVPPQIILGILGVETRYGRIEGNYNVLDTLTTLAFDYPRRSHFFKYELEQYLILLRDSHFNAYQLSGSYAGAFGEPQFMPNDYLQYAVSATNKKFPNLWNNDDDAILSVANYFKAYGWQPGQLVAVRANVVGQAFYSLDNISSLKPIYTVAQLKQYGITPVVKLPANERVNFMVFMSAQGPEYWLGLHNFHVITGYNPSAFYAMTVYQLSEAILEQRNGRGKNQTS